MTKKQAIINLKKGQKFLNEGHVDKAIQCYKKSIELDPNSSNSFEFYHRLGEAFIHKKNLKNAIEAYQEAVKLNPQSEWSYHCLGNAFFWNKDFDRSIDCQRQAIEISPKNAVFYYKLGDALKATSNREEAIICYQKAIELNPKHSQSYQAIGELLSKEGKLEEAVSAYQNAIEINPSIETCYQQLGDVLLRQNKTDEAVSAYLKAIHIQPLFHIPYRRLMYISLNSSQREELIACCKKAIEIQPDWILGYICAGDMLSLKGDIDSAIGYYKTASIKKVLQYKPDFPTNQIDPERDSDVKPDFIIIGGMKCGTTSLYEYITQHPQVLPGLEKEANFFDHRFHKGLDWYLSHFPPIPKGTKFLTGEASPGYINYFKAAARIFSFLPNAKLILLLRNPVDRAISEYHHMVNWAAVEGRPIEEAMLAEMERLKQIDDPSLVDETYWNTQSTYLLKGLYIRFIEKWRLLFPKEQLLVLKSEDLYTNTGSTVKQVFDFLGLPDYQLESYKNYNPGSYNSARTSVQNMLYEYFAPYNQKLEEYLGRKFDWN